MTCDPLWGFMGFELDGRALLEWMRDGTPSARCGVGLSRVGRSGLGEGEVRLAVINSLGPLLQSTIVWWLNQQEFIVSQLWRLEA